MLMSFAQLAMINPIYVNAAAFATDPVERMKFFITSNIASIYPTNTFEKPVGKSNKFDS
jgi:hypothetical protein